MFDVGFAELIVIFVIALLVLGPERLPEVARTVGRWLGRARQMARSMQYELERELDLNNIAGDASPATKTTESDDSDAAVGDEAPSDSASVTPHPTYGRLPERTGADYDDDPEDDFDDPHAHEQDDAAADHTSKADKAGG